MDMSREKKSFFAERFVLKLKKASKPIMLKAKCITLLTALGISSCSYISEYRYRRGSYATPTIGTIYLGVQDLGKHGSLSEGSGVVYTRDGGHIDIGHLRIAADLTESLEKKIFKHLIKNENKFSFDYDHCLFGVDFKYSKNWAVLSKEEKERIASEISINTGMYLASTAITWHEILTWFGYKSTGIFSEFHSAFSWEDTYSNTLGCYIANLAIRDKNNSYKDAMTNALRQELISLGIQPSSIARIAAKNVRGKWYSNDFLCFATMKKRNLDIGLDNGCVTPWLVPSLPNCERAKPKLYPIPTPDISKYGFSLELKIEPKVLEKNKVLKIIYSNREGKYVYPKIHFPVILEYIEKEAVKLYGHDVKAP